MENKKEKTKDGRLSKQLGDFGENLVVFLLGNLKKHRVALVDHEGADIIATDRENSNFKYAVSVKSRWFQTDDASTSFDEKNQRKLITFANEFGMIPCVAYVLIDKLCKYIDVYILKLEDFEKLAIDQNFTGIKKRSKGLTIINTTEGNQKSLRECNLIDHTRINFELWKDNFLGKEGNLE